MTRQTPKSAEIRIIGPRQSGKTTYLATLAYFPHKKQMKQLYAGMEITPVGEDAERLGRMAEDIIMQGNKLAGTFKTNIDYLPFYFFRIKIPSIKGMPPIEIELNTRDYPGKIFEEIPLPHKQSEVEPFIDDLFTANAWMVMLTDWEPGRDKTLYKPAFKKLCEEIFNKEKINPEIKNLRIAVVMSKCERGELWPCRLDPEEDLFRVRLPETYDFLKTKLSPQRLKFFACSSFGVLSDRIGDFDPRPNRYIPDDGSISEFNAFLRIPEQWQPYGLIAPIYWLSTGRTLHDHRL
ncbi:hypothetical protein [Argonema antarcticum]|uniref:hypothetical protein n=1 Tax=Argonema antarcticum TaxID=2942763 RepID=UPI002011025C|nr:hypothetical protein [Argonema antarcticum]MCL1470925.1 hypothetical protein [Argonema antarcticum A004/B2]